MLTLSAYAYIWFSTAENIKAGFEAEINNSNVLGLNIQIDDYKYSGFPLNVSVTARNPSLKMKNPVNGLTYLAKIPNISVLCNLLITKCNVSLDPEKNIEIFKDDNLQKLSEIKFANGIRARAVMDRSYLGAILFEEKVEFENLTKELNLNCDSIIVHNLETNQDVTKITALNLSEIYNHDSSNALISSLNFGFNIQNSPSKGMYLSDVFNNLDVSVKFNISRNESNGSITGQILKLQDIAIKLDDASCNLSGDITVNQSKLPSSMNINVHVDNYDYLIQKYLKMQYQNNQNEIAQNYPIFQTIVEKITGNPYNINKADFNISTAEAPGEKTTIVVGKSNLPDIFAIMLTKYNEK